MDKETKFLASSFARVEFLSFRRAFGSAANPRFVGKYELFGKMEAEHDGQ